MRDFHIRASHGGTLTWGMVALLAVACGGTTSIGDRRGAALGDGGPSSTGGAPGAAGGSNGGNPGKGGNPSQGGSGQGGDPGKGGNPSQGGSGQGGSTGVKCETASDCITPGLCRACPDGSQICDKADCVNGQCVTSLISQICPSTCDLANCAKLTKGIPCCTPTGSCGADPTGLGLQCQPIGVGECAADSDCPIPPMPCMPCADGTCAPTHTRCAGGKCESGIDQCPGTPLWYQLCGTPVCQVPSPPTGVAPCDPTQGEKSGGPCAKVGSQCDPGLGCGILLGCQTAPAGVCPL